MRDETVFALVEVLEVLTAGYKDCAQKICAAENALSDERGSEIVTKMNKAYIQMKKRVASGDAELGLETEKWNESASGIEKVLAGIRKELSQSRG
jgi:hypothetical protein